METWMRGRTSFVVAQRISTVLKADKIVLLEKGRIVAEGTHRELLQSSPIYQEIYASQLGNGFSGALSYDESATIDHGRPTKG
jgi:ATP-binding cassette subfamily B protein